MCASSRAGGQCTVLIITHKFREVMAYADAVTVLRRGQAVHHCQVADTNPGLLAAAMMGAAARRPKSPRWPPPRCRDCRFRGKNGQSSVAGLRQLQSR